MKEMTPNALEWLAPWEAVADGAALETELRGEVAEGHLLYSVPAVAVGRRMDCDDMLFRIEHPSYTLAVVHLTWRTQPEPDPTWPYTVLFHTWEEWIEKCLKPDNAEYEDAE
jgi:hypothetical protein